MVDGVFAQEAKAILINDPHGQDAASFRCTFQVPFLVYKEKIRNFSERMWWPEWHGMNIRSMRLDDPLVGRRCLL
jgi:hypothetical protein